MVTTALHPAAMSEYGGRLLVDGKASLDAYRDLGITHLLTISNPGCAPPVADWFGGKRLDIFFGDVLSSDDAGRYDTKAPTPADIDAVVRFGGDALREEQARLLVCCDYGASRSPAVAYVILASCFGSGHEEEAFQQVMQVRPDAVPNSLVVAMGDDFLHRNGRLMAFLREHNRRLEKEIMGSLS